jgi:cell division protein FtsQ
MKRSRVPRLALDRLALGSVLALPRPSRPPSARSARPRSALPSSPRRSSAGARALSSRALGAIALAAGSFAHAVRARRRVRIVLLALIVAGPVLFGGWRWFRSSSLVAVEHVRVSGVQGPNAREIDDALTAAAKRMTTLHVNPRALLAAAAPFHLVRSLSVSTSFPHGMRIKVVEQLPVAVLDVSGSRTAVAADGVVLGPALVSASLPTVSGAYEPPPGGVVHDGSLVGELAVLGAAPHALTPFIARSFMGPRGLTVAMRDGLEAFFGDSTRPHAKWLALCVVLSDSSSAHASAIDVRSPERAAASYPPGYAPTTAASGEGSGASAGSSSESIATELAAGLAASAGYGSSAEAQGANAAKAAEAISPSHSAGESESESPPSHSSESQESSPAQRESAASGGGESSANGATAAPTTGG